MGFLRREGDIVISKEFLYSDQFNNFLKDNLGQRLQFDVACGCKLFFEDENGLTEGTDPYGQDVLFNYGDVDSMVTWLKNWTEIDFPYGHMGVVIPLNNIPGD